MVFYVREGKGAVEIGEERAKVVADMLIESSAKIAHRWINESHEPLANDFALHVPLPCSPDVQGMNEVISSCRAVFEHLDVTVKDMVAEGDRVAACFATRGIRKVAFMGLPATGKSITMTGIEVLRIENGRIAELWGVANLLGLMQQLDILLPFG